MKYKVCITETLEKIVEVEANSFDEAYRIVKDEYCNEEHVLGSEHCTDTSITVIDEGGES